MDRIIEEQAELEKIVGEKPLVGKVKKASKLNGDVLEQEINMIHERFSVFSILLILFFLDYKKGILQMCVNK